MKVHIDTRCEEVIAGVAAISYMGALAATDRLTGGMFYDPRYGRVLEVGAVTTDELSYEDRIDRIAEQAGQYPAWLREVVARCPVQWDIDGRWADRVLASYQRRREIEATWARLQDLAAS